MLTLSDLATVIDSIAPFKLAYEWDNVGIQIGNSSQQIQKLLIALEINDAVIDYAVRTSCQAILTHHPLIFQPIRAIREDHETGRLQAKLIRSGISLIAAHTNLD